VVAETVGRKDFEGGSVIFGFYQPCVANARSGKGDVMVDHDFCEELAGLLDVGRQEAALLLGRFSSAMAAELLAVRKLSLKGLGSFTVTHVTAAKKSRASTVVYTPPGNRLTFTTRLTGSDDTARLAVSRLSMSQKEAERFGVALAALFRLAVQQQREIRLNGIGRVALEKGAYVFFPERSLEELLNREYQDLQEVVLPLREQKYSKLRYLVPLSLCTIIILLLAFRYGVEPNPVPSPSAVHHPSGIAKDAVHAKRFPAEVHSERVMKGRLMAPHAAMAEANTLLELAPESYTIVLVTLSKPESLHKELVRLRSEGVIAFVWPAEVNGIKYYRIITGIFSNRHAAKERIGQLTQKTADDAYIQHLLKRVVLHGEKGL